MLKFGEVKSCVVIITELVAEVVLVLVDSIVVVVIEVKLDVNGFEVICCEVEVISVGVVEWPVVKNVSPDPLPKSPEPDSEPASKSGVQ